MDFKFGNFIFSSNFDSGNLLNVEKVILGEENYNNHCLSTAETFKVDYEFNLWTKADCGGTEFENGNRTWFYFSVRGYAPGRTVRLTVKNLNRQQRLYAQGYAPLFKTETGNKENDKWLRIRNRPTWENNENNFQLTFTHRFSDIKFTVTYFAFCYPWSYNDCQKQLETLDKKYDLFSNYSWEELLKCDSNAIYYKRELFTRSLEGRRVDLITITDLEGLCNEREEIFDKKLFPDRDSRPWKFDNKKVFVVTSRVHPGETPSSHVFNGFLNFILRPDDPRSVQLRNQYIFKLIPLLNPDGVYRGHYRTDTRGVNLNRVYLNPDFNLHSPIYAAKSLLVYHHISNSYLSKEKISIIKSVVFNEIMFENFKVDFMKVEGKSSNHSTPLNNELDSQRSIVIGIENVFSGIVESMDVISKCIKNDDLENEMECKDDMNQTTAPNISLINDNHTKNTQTSTSTSCNSLKVDFLEVTVEIESSKQDLTSKNELLKEPQKFQEPYIEIEDNHKNETNEQKIEPPFSILFNNDNQSQNQSIYRFFKSSNKSNHTTSLSCTSSQSKNTHKWNLRCNQASLTEPTKGKITQSDVTNQAIRTKKKHQTSMIPLPLRPAIVSMKFSSKKINKVSLDSSQLSTIKKELQSLNGFKSESKIGNEGSDDDSEVDCFFGKNENNQNSIHLNHPYLLDILPEKSGIAFYVDLHGHCSKRGCFMYGNCLESDKDMNDNLLFPKLISLNSPHFDFSGCNFSLKNMYTKDKKDGSSKEGAGRVAIWKHLGLIHSYTLECNYNTGRTTNVIPSASKDDGRASPPSLDATSSLPPKYTPFHFEDVGKAMAIAALDIYHTNPWSRIINSDYSTLQNIKEYLRKYLSGQKTGFRQPFSFRRPNRITKQPFTKGVQILSKTLSNQLEYSRSNKPQGINTMSAPRKSQTSISFLSTQQNSNLIRPILSNGQKHHDRRVSLEIDKNILSIGTIDQDDVTQTNGQNVTSSLSKFDQMMKSEIAKAYVKKQELNFKKFPINSSNCIKNQIKQEMPDLVESFSTHIIKDENIVTEVNNQNNSASKPNELSRKNSISYCFLEETMYNLLEKEKLDELKEILLDEKGYKNSKTNIRTQSFNFDERSCDGKKEPIKKKVLSKMISFSSNDVSY